MHWRSAVLLLACIGFVSAQSTAILRGGLTDAQGSPISGGIIRLENALTGFSRHAVTADDGSFQITNIPFQTYVVTALKDGFAPSTQHLPLRTNVPQELKDPARPGSQLTRVEVNATEATASGRPRRNRHSD